MTIIKDQLIEAQLEVIDNSSLPSGRPVGSVYYNKTTEKIQTVKQDGNLRNVFYEDEIAYPSIPDHTVPYISASSFGDLSLPLYSSNYQKITNVNVVIGNTYRVTTKHTLYATGGVSTGLLVFNDSVADSSLSNVGFPNGNHLYSVQATAANVSYTEVNSTFIFTATTTALSLFAAKTSGTLTVLGTNFWTGVNTGVWRFEIEKLPFHSDTWSA